MNKIQITRTNGNIVKPLADKDGCAAIVLYGAGVTIPTGMTTGVYVKLQCVADATTAGIVTTEDEPAVNMLRHHVEEFFRVCPNGTLYAALWTAGQNDVDDCVEAASNQSNGDVRLLGFEVVGANVAESETMISAIQTAAAALDTNNAPLSVIFCSTKTEVLNSLPTSPAVAGRNRVSVLIGTDRDAAVDECSSWACPALGVALGIAASASVHESIAWVKKFPTGITKPGITTGVAYNQLPKATISTLDEGRYLFFVTYPGLNNSYLNDSHTMDVATSDYAYIENVRTMDKAVRGIRTYLIPELGGPIKVDASTGKLAPETVAHLKTVANYQLEAMEAAGELSGYKADIDEDQNVLATSTVKIVIKQVAVGVMRTVDISIGYTESV